jgi:prepilin-type N-terminal cleavage/methylation domain-containing protein
MECNATSTNRSLRGFTLVEFMVTAALSSFVLLALASLLSYTGRSFGALVNYSDLDKHSRNTLDVMSSKIRQADELLEFSSNRLVFSYHGTNRLTYIYSPVARTLVEIEGTSRKVLLKECDSLTFSIFQRNTASGTYDQFPSTMTDNAAKLVQVNWTSSRALLRAKMNTESVQSAKIVIRN